MKSKLLVFLAIATVIAGCGDKKDDRPNNNNNDVQVGELDNINPYEVPANAMSFQDSQDLWRRARNAENVIPAGEAYLRTYPELGKIKSVSEQDRRTARQSLNSQGRRFMQSMNRNCEINEPQSQRGQNQLYYSVGGNRCPIQSAYNADNQFTENLFSSTVTNQYTFNQDLAYASGVLSIQSKNFIKLEESEGRSRRQSGRMYGRGEMTVDYFDGVKVLVITKYDIANGRKKSSSKILTEVHSRRGILRIVIIEDRNTRQATINGQNVDYDKALAGYAPRLSISSRN